MADDDDDALYQARVGTVIGGKYLLARLLGAGGMGAVYEAENTWIKRRVAIKVLRADLMGNQELVQRFMQEAQSAAQIEHPNIVDVLDLGQEPSDGSFFIVQEFLTGSDLRRHLEDVGRMAPRDAIAVVAPIMSALVAVHGHGIVHRDLKPENIFLSRTATGEVVPKLIDFGVSKMLNTLPGMTKTRTGMSVGTPYYMSPEQARGDSSVDAGTDVWAVGVVLFELLAGKPPFDAANYNLLIVRIITERPPLIESVAPDVPYELAEVVNSALEPDRAKRFASMQAFLDAVTRFTLTSPGALQAMEAVGGAGRSGAHVAWPVSASPSGVGPIGHRGKNATLPAPATPPPVGQLPTATPPRRGGAGRVLGVSVVILAVGAATAAVVAQQVGVLAWPWAPPRPSFTPDASSAAVSPLARDGGGAVMPAALGADASGAAAATLLDAGTARMLADASGASPATTRLDAGTDVPVPARFDAHADGATVPDASSANATVARLDAGGVADAHTDEAPAPDAGGSRAPTVRVPVVHPPTRPDYPVYQQAAAAARRMSHLADGLSSHSSRRTHLRSQATTMTNMVAQARALDDEALAHLASDPHGAEHLRRRAQGIRAELSHWLEHLDPAERGGN